MLFRGHTGFRLINRIKRRHNKHRSKKENKEFIKETVKPLVSRYSYGSEVDKRMIERVRIRTGRKS